MERNLVLLVLVLCVTGGSYAAKKPKPPKAVKQLNQVCLARGIDLLVVNEPEYEFVFAEGMDDFCDTLLEELDGYGKDPTKPVDGVRVMKKVCKWYEKKYNPEDVEVSLDGLDDVCGNFSLAEDAGLGDKTSKKALKKLTGLCEAMDEDRVAEYDDMYDDVFDDLGEFCVDYMNDSSIHSKKRQKEVNGTETLGEVCDWFTVKYEQVPPYGVMVGLEPICEDFIEILEGGGDDTDLSGLVEEKEFWVLVDLCEAAESNTLQPLPDNYTDVFDDLEEFCSDFLDDVDGVMKEEKMKKKKDGVMMLDTVCSWLEDWVEEEGSMDVLADLEPICEDFAEVYDEDDDDDDDDDDFELFEEEEFYKLLFLCEAIENGTLGEIEPDFIDVFDDMENFCTDLFDDLEEMKDINVAIMSKRKDEGDDKEDWDEEDWGDKEGWAVDLMEDVCEWLEDVEDEEGSIELLEELEPICSEFQEIIDDDDDDDDDDDNFELFEEEEFYKLLFLCEAIENGTLGEIESDFIDVFDDMEDFCTDLFDDLEDMKDETMVGIMSKLKDDGDDEDWDEEDWGDKEGWAVDLMEDVCEWLEDVEDEEGSIELLEELEPICSEFQEIIDDDDDDDDDDDFELFEEEEFYKLLFLCEAIENGTLGEIESDFTDVFDDMEDFCTDLFEDLDDMKVGIMSKLKDEGDDEDWDEEDWGDKEGWAVDLMEDVCEWLEDVGDEEGSIELLEELEPICMEFQEIMDDDDDDSDDSDEFTLEEEDGFWTVVEICEADQKGKVRVSNESYKDVFEDLGDFCTDFLVDIKEDEVDTMKKLDGIPMLEEICEWLDDVIEEEGSIDVLAGLEPICADFQQLYGDDDDDEFELFEEEEFVKLVYMCKEEADGELVNPDEVFDDVFDDFGDFCDDLLDDFDDIETDDIEMEEDEDAIDMLEDVCEWLDDNSDEGDSGDLFDDLLSVCDDLFDILDDEGDDDDDDDDDEFKLEEEDGFWTVVEICEADQKGLVGVSNESYTDVFEDLGDFCTDFLEDIKEDEVETKKGGTLDGIPMLDEICDWLDDVIEEEGSIDVLAGLEPICADFQDLYGDDDEDDFELFEEEEFVKLVYMCKEEADGELVNPDEVFDDVFDDFGDFCDDLLDDFDDIETDDIEMEEDEDAIDMLEDVCEWLDDNSDEGDSGDLFDDLLSVCDDLFDILDDEGDDDDDDDDDEFKLEEEDGFWTVVEICEADQKGLVGVSNESYTDVFEDLGDFCTDFLEDIKEDEVETKKGGTLDGIPMLDEICDWLDDVIEEEGSIDVLAGLEPICADFQDLYGDDDDDDFELFEEEEFVKLVYMCKEEADGELDNPDEVFDDVFDDFGDFCDDLLDDFGDIETDDIEMEEEEDAVDMLEDICEWLDDNSDEGDSGDLFDDLLSVCDDLFDILDDEGDVKIQ